MTTYYRDEMQSREVCYSSADEVRFMSIDALLLALSLLQLTITICQKLKMLFMFIDHFTQIQQLIKEKRKALVADDQTNGNIINNNNNIVNHIKSNYGKQYQNEDIPTRKIFIDHVLCNETKFNDAEVRDHVYTIVAAGSETTALQTAHTVYAN
jgi:hypothetical protein